jgi:hypothetical protein
VVSFVQGISPREGLEGQPPGFLFNHFRRSDHGVDGDQVVSGFHGQRPILDRLRPRLSNITLAPCGSLTSGSSDSCIRFATDVRTAS